MPEGTDRLHVGVVVGSTRPERRADGVARWVLDGARRVDGARFSLVDLADQPLPMFDEEIPPIMGRYARAHTKAWADVVRPLDAFVFVTPEYNRSIPAALKNAIDFLYDEWRDKAAGFVSYGVDAGGARAVEHLRLVMAEVHVATVRGHVALSVGDDFGANGPDPRPIHADKLDAMLSQLVAWGGALRELRARSAA